MYYNRLFYIVNRKLDVSLYTCTYAYVRHATHRAVRPPLAVRVDLEPVWGQFGIDLGSIWGRLGIDVGPIWDRFGARFGVSLGSIGVDLGLDLGSFWDQLGVSANIAVHCTYKQYYTCVYAVCAYIDR